jgi:hypothetical protein
MRQSQQQKQQVSPVRHSRVGGNPGFISRAQAEPGTEQMLLLSCVAAPAAKSKSTMRVGLPAFDFAALRSGRTEIEPTARSASLSSTLDLPCYFSSPILQERKPACPTRYMS